MEQGDTDVNRELIIGGVIFAISVVGIILVSNFARINHDELVRQQAVETCKEFK